MEATEEASDERLDGIGRGAYGRERGRRSLTPVGQYDESSRRAVEDILIARKRAPIGILPERVEAPAGS